MREVPPFAAMREALADVVCWEKHRLGMLDDLIVRGSGIEPGPDIAFAGMRERLRRLDGLLRFLGIVTPMEVAIRAVAELGPPPNSEPTPPTLWRA